MNPEEGTPEAETPDPTTPELSESAGTEEPPLPPRQADPGKPTPTEPAPSPKTVIGYQHNEIAQGPTEPPLSSLVQPLPSLPRKLHSFRDPRHPQLVAELEKERILLLSSFPVTAAYVAAHAVVNDEFFREHDKRSLSPARNREKARLDLELTALATDEVIDARQILVIEINAPCSLLDSALRLGHVDEGHIVQWLTQHQAGLVLVVDEDLLTNEGGSRKTEESLDLHSVSHLRYLLARDLEERADAIEAELQPFVDRGFMALREMTDRVKNCLKAGPEALEELLLKLRGARNSTPAEFKRLFQPIEAHELLRRPSELHRTAIFVCTFFPDLGQEDFDRLVLLLLGDETETTIRVRQVVAGDGSVVTIREELSEACSERWRRSADEILVECKLVTAPSDAGPWTVEFEELYLRRELRGYFERSAPWYLRNQSCKLQQSGALFFFDWSPRAADALIRLFVDRAIADPSGFGSSWLLALVKGLRVQLPGEPPSDDPDEALKWLFEKLALEAQLRAHFVRRLAALIREFLGEETLRLMVTEFLNSLLQLGQHEALLDLLLDLARRLRFAPHFDALNWLRKILDQGDQDVRRRAERSLLALARESGSRLYEFLSGLRSWLVEPERGGGKGRLSTKFALDFPYLLCAELSRSFPDSALGSWPSRYPLFFALSTTEPDPRTTLTAFLDWLLDPRIGIELTGGTERRIERIAEVLEHWAWVLEGKVQDGSSDGKELFAIVLEVTAARLAPQELLALQRAWQRRQEECLREATAASQTQGSARSFLLGRRAKLDSLRTRMQEAFAAPKEPLVTKL